MTLLHRLDWQTFIVRSRPFQCVLSLGAACLVFALGCLIRLPEWRQMHQVEQARHRALSEEQQAKAAQLLAHTLTQETLRQTTQDLQDSRWRLAAGGDISDLLDQLTASGHAYGLHFEQLDVLDEVAKPGFRQSPLQVQVVGRYAALRMWLDDWLGQIRLLRAGDLQMASAEERPGLLRLRLRVNAFQADGPVPEPGSLALMPARDEVVPPALDPFSAWSTRVVREGLAKVPLAQLEMVGSLSRGMGHEALVLSAGRLYRVRLGDPLGRDEGVVVHIGERQVEVRERLFVGGTWRERMTMLTLRKGVDRGGKDDDEKLDDVADGGRAADALASGNALSR
ncbi:MULTISPECIES: pilus assembly protein PilP [unclassified Pseudomonas]|uniref:pilus assembly protein PilP n=1 Tax=unclassified Pseudomonas TaxID=196821 RepID=UPI0037F6C618